MSTALPLDEISITSLEVKANPFPLLRRFREEDPCHWVPEMGVWLLSRYDDIKQMYTDPRVTADRRRWEHYVQPEEGSFGLWVDEHGLMSVSPKEHTRLRKLLASGFTPRGVARMDGQIREVVGRYGDRLKGRTGVVDIMAEFTTPIPNAVISAITGVGAPGSDAERFSELAQAVIHGFFGFVSDEVKQRSTQAYRELSSWVLDTIVERRLEPRDDLISDLIAAREGADQLSDDDLVGFVSALLAAGSETTATSGMRAIMTLLDHPEALDRLRADRSLIPQTVNEVLRFSFAGIAGTQRFAIEDFEFHGKPIRKGQMLLLSSGGHSYDPKVYDDPEKFDIDRNPKDLLAFGVGPHYCLGANLARGELACIIDAACDFLPPGARVLKEQIEIQSLGLFDRAMTCPIDFGDGTTASASAR